MSVQYSLPRAAEIAPRVRVLRTRGTITARGPQGPKTTTGTEVPVEASKPALAGLCYRRLLSSMRRRSTYQNKVAMVENNLSAAAT